MYQKLYIDKNLKDNISSDIKQLFFDNEIPFEFIESPDIFESNVLFLTDNKNNLSSTLANVFLMKQEYDFLDVKNAIFIRSVEDIVRVLKMMVWKNGHKSFNFFLNAV